MDAFYHCILMMNLNIKFDEIEKKAFGFPYLLSQSACRTKVGQNHQQNARLEGVSLIKNNPLLPILLGPLAHRVSPELGAKLGVVF